MEKNKDKIGKHLRFAYELLNSPNGTQWTGSGGNELKYLDRLAISQIVP